MSPSNNNNSNGLHPARDDSDATKDRHDDPDTNDTNHRPRACPHLRQNLTREQYNRDPLFYYTVEQVLGIGSMGSVVKVRHRASGGSARPDRQRQLRRLRRHDATSDDNNDPACLQWGDAVVDLWAQIVAAVRGGCPQQSALVKAPAAAAFVWTDEPLDDESSSTHSDDQHQTGTYAMKSIHLSRVTDDLYRQELKNEIQILRTLDHPHIVKALEVFEHRQQLFIVMELCHGGDLYTRDPYTESQAARIVQSILSAIAYMHSKHLLHRDLKYENILFADTSPASEIKLIDFGLSAAFGNDELTDGVGTIYTMAPEVLNGKYSTGADVWSIGVIAYMLLSSQMPFYGKKRQHIVESIRNGQFQFNGRRWKRVSSQAKQFVRDLLVVDPQQRLSAEQALSSPWLRQGHRRRSSRMSLPEDDAHHHSQTNNQMLEAAHQSMANYAKYSKLKQVALMVIAHRSTSEEVGVLRRLFQTYDDGGRGYVTLEQFESVMERAGYGPDQVKQIFEALDLDGSGQIRYTEFLASTIEAQGAIDERRLAEAFDRLDSDDSGYITVANLREMLGDNFPREEIEQILKESSAKNGKVSYMDFLAQWQGHKESKRQDWMADLSNLSASADEPSSSYDADKHASYADI